MTDIKIMVYSGSFYGITAELESEHHAIPQWNHRIPAMIRLVTNSRTRLLWKDYIDITVKHWTCHWHGTPSSRVNVTVFQGSLEDSIIMAIKPSASDGTNAGRKRKTYIFVRRQQLV